MRHRFYILLALITVITACEPVRDDEYNLNGEAPKPSIEVTAIDGNTFIVKDNTPTVSNDFGHSRRTARQFNGSC
ncbi:MAG: hypothetical protein IPH94_16000 [Saprospiraceae bacterium]|nr:hypothetical protein [Saprospiraceae bacterium]